MNRLIVVPRQKQEELALELLADLKANAARLRAENLAGFMGAVEIGTLTRAAAHAAPGAHELLVWARADRGYGVAWTSLEPTEDMVGAASAEPEEGLVSEVFASGRTEFRTADELQTEGWTNAEKRRGRPIRGMVASPVFVGGECVAVLTLVQYGPDAAAGTFGREDAGALTAEATLLGRLLEDRLIRILSGLNPS